jgi:hypothetical protein
LLNQVFRYAIGQAKRNKVDGAFLLPMRKPAFRTTNVCVRIEELKIVAVHGGDGLRQDKQGTALSNRRSFNSAETIRAD